MTGTTNASIPTQEGGISKMPELTGTKQKVVNAALGRKLEYLRIIDWAGKSLTFILADEIRPEEKGTSLGTEEGKRQTAP